MHAMRSSMDLSMLQLPEARTSTGSESMRKRACGFGGALGLGSGLGPGQGLGLWLGFRSVHQEVRHVTEDGHPRASSWADLNPNHNP